MTITQAIGLTNMTHRHPGPPVRTAPSRIPIAEDSPATAAQTPSADWAGRRRWLSGGPGVGCWDGRGMLCILVTQAHKGAR